MWTLRYQKIVKIIIIKKLLFEMSLIIQNYYSKYHQDTNIINNTNKNG